MENESDKNKGEGCLKLFGVKIMNGTEEGESMKTRSLSLETLQSSNGEDGWSVSDEAQAVHSRKKVVHWSTEEHQNFLAGLEKLGKGNWAGISRNFVRSRTPTQVASHAQKYFLRKSACDKRNRRLSMFDIPLQPVSSPQISLGLERSNEISTQPTQVHIGAPRANPLSSLYIGTPRLSTMPTTPVASDFRMVPCMVGATIEDLSTKNLIPGGLLLWTTCFPSIKCSPHSPYCHNMGLF